MSRSELMIGERILMHLPDGSAVSSRLRGTDADSLILYAPAMAPGTQPQVGDEIDVQWFRSRGRYEMRTLLVETYRAQGRPCWQLAPVADPVLQQDRRYVRGPGGQPAVVISRTAGELTGVVMDLAEMSVRIRFPQGAPSLHEQVKVDLEVQDRRIVAPAQVVRVSATGSGSEVDVVLVMDVTTAQADQLRAFIFQRQRRELRTTLT